MQKFVSMMGIVLLRTEHSRLGQLSPPTRAGDSARRGLKSPTGLDGAMGTHQTLAVAMEERRNLGQRGRSLPKVMACGLCLHPTCP